MKHLYTARSSFAVEVLDSPAPCRGCGHSFKSGASAYVQHWKNLGKPVCTVLCNLEGCWEEYDSQVFTGGHPFDGLEREFDMYEGPTY
jgi:hypothetical protein